MPPQNPPRKAVRSPGAPARGSARRRHRALGRDAIVQVALQIVDAKGIDLVSMRSVAAEFDTGPASLYVYFDNKDALLHAVVDHVLDQMPIPEGEDWRTMLRNHAHTSRALLARHNDLARLTFAHIPNSLRMFDAAEALLKSMIESGVPPRVAAWALDNLSVHVASTVYDAYLKRTRFGDDSGRDPEELRAAQFVAGVGRAFAATSPTRFPYLIKNADALMAGTQDDRFAFSIDTLIAGLAAYDQAVLSPGDHMIERPRP
ncbi:TetR/AcrR family transcriptional regulator [Streptomyces sp. MMS24-I29]|uniref:TetR/AcrR family transcriptional regulator n=1 Tax=Streptomyces sp. MMS24-I29 TaxID=3351480 RepID=UPI003C7AF261